MDTIKINDSKVAIKDTYDVDYKPLINEISIQNG